MQEITFNQIREGDEVRIERKDVSSKKYTRELTITGIVKDAWSDYLVFEGSNVYSTPISTNSTEKIYLVNREWQPPTEPGFYTTAKNTTLLTEDKDADIVYVDSYGDLTLVNCPEESVYFTRRAIENNLEFHKLVIQKGENE